MDRQPPIEVALETPVLKREVGNEVIVEIVSKHGRIIELKRFESA